MKIVSTLTIIFALMLSSCASSTLHAGEYMIPIAAGCLLGISSGRYASLNAHRNATEHRGTSRAVTLMGYDDTWLNNLGPDIMKKLKQILNSTHL